jgi:hypothetical protein
LVRKKVTAARSGGNLNGATRLIHTTALTVVDHLDNRRVMRAKDAQSVGNYMKYTSAGDGTMNGGHAVQDGKIPEEAAEASRYVLAA